MGGQTVVDVLTDAHAAQYERDGYLIVDHVDVPAGTLDAVVDDLDGLYVSPARDEDGIHYGVHRIRNAWRRSPNIKALALAPNVLAILEALWP